MSGAMVARIGARLAKLRFVKFDLRLESKTCYDRMIWHDAFTFFESFSSQNKSVGGATSGPNCS